MQQPCLWCSQLFLANNALCLLTQVRDSWTVAARMGDVPGTYIAAALIPALIIAILFFFVGSTGSCTAVAHAGMHSSNCKTGMLSCCIILSACPLHLRLCASYSSLSAVKTLLPLVCLIALQDHNVSSQMAQQPEFGLTKPPAYHYDMLLLAGLVRDGSGTANCSLLHTSGN